MRKKAIDKEQVFEKASEIIKNEGYEACTMRRLAGELGVAVGTFYNYYKSQEELLEEIFIASWNKTFERLDIVLNKKLDTNGLFKEYCFLLSDEIKARSGLGGIVMKGLFIDKDYNLEESGFTLLETLQSQMVKILKMSEKNEHLDDKGFKMIAHWIVLAIISSVKKDEERIEGAIDELIYRYL